MKEKKIFRFEWAKHQQRWFGKWHLYLGLIAGAIVAFVGITGSILVFQDEIDEALNPALFKVMAQQHKISFGEILPVIKQKYPTLKISYLLNEADEPNKAYRAYNFITEEETFINPYTAEICGKRIYESSFIHIVTELHRTLLIPVVGRYIVGLATLCLLILTISGLRLWIPQKWKHLKSVLTINFKAGFRRQNYDWHNVLGFYSAPVVTMLALSGFCITFSPVIIAFIFLFNGKTPQSVVQLLNPPSAYSAQASPLPVSEIMAIGQKALPGSRVAGIALPADSTRSYRLDIVSKGLPEDGKREMVIIDQYTGKILVNSSKDFPASGKAYLSWLTPVHYGSFAGRPTQILALLGGLMPAALFVTGFIIWWPRYKKQKSKPAKPMRLSSVNVTTPSVWQYFLTNFIKGLRYALWCLPVTAVLGALYGLISGIVMQPAVFAVIFTALIVVMNFIIAFLVLIFSFIFLLPFKKNSRLTFRYFALSLSFVIVFLVAYLLLVNTGIPIFD